MNAPGLNRRDLLRYGAALGLGSVTLPALSACGAGAGSGPSATRVRLPAYKAEALASAQEPGNAAGVRDGYWHYPSHLVKSVHETPGRGGTVTALVITYQPPPPAESQNAFWQELNRQMGVSFKPTLVAQADWKAKLATTMASGDLPDMILLQGSIPHLIEFLQAKCQDLTDHLAGDAIKAYPNLANIPANAWKPTAFNGRLYGFPQPSGVFGGGLFIQQNLADAAGIGQPKNSDDFRRLMMDLTRPKQGIWGMGASMNSNYNLGFFYQIFGVPNGWKVDKNGHFTADIETQQAKAAVSYARQLFSDGVYHPDANNMTTVQSKQAFWGSRIAAYVDGIGAYSGAWENGKKNNPSFNPRVVIPFGHAGGKGQYYFGTGTFGVTALKKASASRVKELTRIANYLAAPFGTTENFFFTNGVKGADYTLDSQGDPVLTQRGQVEMGASNAESSLKLDLLVRGPSVDVGIHQPDFIKAIHGQEEQLVPIGIEDPTVGLYSETQQSKGADLTTLINDQVSQVINGRSPMSAFDTLVQDWRSQGGDTIKEEYQRAWEGVHHPAKK